MSNKYILIPLNLPKFLTVLITHIFQFIVVAFNVKPWVQSSSYLLWLFRCRSKSGNGRGFEDGGIAGGDVGDANVGLERHHVGTT